MIGYLNGEIVTIEDKSVIVSVGGVGYKVFTSTDTLDKIKNDKIDGGSTVEFWTYLSVRENSLELFGFLQKEEKNFFELLLGVSGIGPRSALSVLGVASVKALSSAIASGDIGYLTKVSGIGRKTAEKIVIELKDKVTVSDINNTAADMRAGSDAIEALKSLGYQEREARDAVKSLPSEIKETNKQIREALKILGANK